MVVQVAPLTPLEEMREKFLRKPVSALDGEATSSLRRALTDKLRGGAAVSGGQVYAVPAAIHHHRGSASIIAQYERAFAFA